MTKEIKKIRLSELSHNGNLDDIKSDGIAIVTSSNKQVGIITNTALSQKLIGNKTWDTDRYGIAVSEIGQDTFMQRRSFIPLQGKESSNTHCFSQNFIEDNWEKIQLALPPKITAGIATAFSLSTFQHIEIDAKGLNAIEVSPDYAFAHTRIHRIRSADSNKNSISFTELAEQINLYGRAIHLTQQGNGTKQDNVARAILAPISKLSEIQNSGIQIKHMGFQTIKRTTNIGMENDTAYVISHTKHPEDTFIAISPNASSALRNIVTPREDSPHLLSGTGVNIQADFALSAKNKYELCEKLNELFIELKDQKATKIIDVSTPLTQTRRIAITGNPDVINALKKVPTGDLYKAKNIDPKSILFQMTAETSLFQCPKFIAARTQTSIYETDEFKKLDSKITKLFCALYANEDSVSMNSDFAVTASPNVVAKVHDTRQHLKH